jgi:small conductance mechanosensitive channel
MDIAQTAQDLSSLATVAWAAFADFLPRLVAAVVILVLGYIVAGWAARTTRRVLERTGQLDPTLLPVMGATMRYGILIFVFIAALSQLGVQTTSVLAALGAAGLAIGLALQGTLQNIAAGMMLLWLRPFRVGDYIEGASVAGTVEELALFATRLRTWDGIYKFVPNSELWNTILTNYTRNATRLNLIEFGIAYEDDIAEGRRVLKEHAEAHPKVLKNPEVQVVPLSLGDSAVVLQLRAWVNTSEFWAIRWDLTQGGKQALEAAGITIPFPQRVVHMANAAPPPAPGDQPRAA